ncbi:hypothetical protein UFOVP75_163 [uncultured Caudovirales phage]|uniref:Uncharacterized protein n=1 Tax=uncultured Caudovirales phage TaxID=2100421 RepID=A0A6J5KZ78_9CAUD|nr:hypothetical protein UFOVP75_163 [uncultured Caudovirales phage]
MKKPKWGVYADSRNTYIEDNETSKGIATMDAFAPQYAKLLASSPELQAHALEVCRLLENTEYASHESVRDLRIAVARSKNVDVEHDGYVSGDEAARSEFWRPT